MKSQATKPTSTQRPARVLDGAYGPLLCTAGVDPSRPLVEAVLTHPKLVADAHATFVEAGAELIVTLTAAANRLVLARLGLVDQLNRVNGDAVALARRSASASTMVFGALGSSNLLLALDEVTPEDLADAFSEQAELLLAAGVDGLVIEGMSDLAEAVAAVEAVRRSAKTPLAACMTFQAQGDSFATADDVQPAAAATALQAAGADWVGCHGGVPLTESRPLVESLAAATSKSLWVRLDVAQPEYHDKALVYRQSPEEFAASVERLLDLRVEMLGGCRGATPAHVAALRAALSGAA